VSTPELPDERVNAFFTVGVDGAAAGVNSAVWVTCLVCGACVLDLKHEIVHRRTHAEWHLAAEDSSWRDVAWERADPHSATADQAALIRALAQLVPSLVLQTPVWVPHRNVRDAWLKTVVVDLRRSVGDGDHAVVAVVGVPGNARVIGAGWGWDPSLLWLVHARDVHLSEPT